MQILPLSVVKSDVPIRNQRLNSTKQILKPYFRVRRILPFFLPCLLSTLLQDLLILLQLFPKSIRMTFIITWVYVYVDKQSCNIGQILELKGVREHGREHRRLKSTTFNYADSRSSGYPQGHFYIRFSHISQLSYRWVTKTLWVFRRNLIFLPHFITTKEERINFTILSV